MSLFWGYLPSRMDKARQVKGIDLCCRMYFGVALYVWMDFLISFSILFSTDYSLPAVWLRLRTEISVCQRSYDFGISKTWEHYWVIWSCNAWMLCPVSCPGELGGLGCMTAAVHASYTGLRPIWVPVWSSLWDLSKGCLVGSRRFWGIIWIPFLTFAMPPEPFWKSRLWRMSPNLLSQNPWSVPVELNNECVLYHKSRKSYSC